MKVKTITFLFLTIATLVFAACNSNTPNASDTSDVSHVSDLSNVENASTSSDLSSEESMPDTSLVYEDLPCGCTFPRIPALSDVPGVPGSLIDVNRIPDADQTNVNKVISSVLSSHCQKEGLSLAYYISDDASKERLVITQVHDAALAQLWVYETSFGSAKAFYEAVTTADFDAKLIANIYIDFPEGQYAHIQSAKPTYDYFFTDDETVTSADAANSNMLFCGLSFADNGREVAVYKLTDKPGEYMESQLEVYNRIYSRYNERHGLESLVKVD